MAIFYKNVDMFDKAKELASEGAKVLLLVAVNQTKVDYDGKPLVWDNSGDYNAQFGSMSAGTSYQLAQMYPEVRRWWSKTCCSSGMTNVTLTGVHVYRAVSPNLFVGVGVIKDVWWQEAPKDAMRIKWFARMIFENVKILAKGYDYIVMPLVGAGYGRMGTDNMIALAVSCNLPDNVFIHYLD